MAIVNPRTAGTARTLTGLALILGLVLTGCGNSDGDDEGTSGATSTPTTTTSTQPSEGEYVPASADGPAQNVPVPELPEEAKEQSIEGAEATLEYWWKTLEYLYLTGDSEPLENVSDSNCVTCNNNAKNWTALYADDHWIVLDDASEIRDVETVLDDDALSADIRYGLDPSHASTYTPDSELLDESFTQDPNQRWRAEVAFNTTSLRWEVYETSPDTQDG